VQPGDVLSERFELLSVAGAGGMGTVYRATDRTDGSLVAVKVLLGDLSPALAARFAREARMLAQLHHPGIVRYVAHGHTAAGEPFLVMQWLEGETLGSRLRKGPLELGQTVGLCGRVAEALSVAHASGIVHRDVKPENLLLAGGDLRRVRLLDFGIARGGEGTLVRTRTGALLGSPGYMAPEQARGDAIDARTDIFALGCVLFECVTGQPAFAGSSVIAVLSKVLLEQAPRLRDLRPDVPAALDELTARMLAKAPDSRPATMAHVASELDALLAVLPEVAPALDEAAAPASPPPLRRALTASEQRLLSVVVAPAAVASTLGMELATLPADSDTRQPRPGSDLETLRGTLARFDADLQVLFDGSLLVVLSGASAATDQTAQAARAALALLQQRPRARIGLATGLGLLDGGGVTGEVIERATQLACRGGPGICLDQTTARLLEGRFAIAILGQGEATLLEELKAPGDGRTLLGKTTPCVGRERELGKLLDHLHECAEDRIARAVLVTAQPGVGKSRLCREALHLMRRQPGGEATWLARCEPMRAGSPLGLVAQLLTAVTGLREGEAPAARHQRLEAHFATRLDPERMARCAGILGNLVGAAAAEEPPFLQAARRDPGIMGEQVRRAWIDWLGAECARAPLVIAIEDLHWSDAPSVRLLDVALGELAEQPLLVMAFARPEVHERFPGLWRERHLHELTLRELSRKASERLVREVLGQDTPAEQVERLVVCASGNAFFLEELIRGQAEGKAEVLPDTVMAMAQVRFERLPADGRRVLRAASVLGEIFWGGAVAALLGGDPAAERDSRQWLEAMVEREVITVRPQARFPGEREHQFRHALVRDAAYAALTAEDRIVGHRLAGAWLEAHGESEAALLAEHFDRGQDQERAIAAHARAAAQALARNDFQLAIDRVNHILERGAEGLLLRELLVIRGRAQVGRSRWGEARVDLRAALEMLAAEALSERAELLHDLTLCSDLLLDMDEARRHGLLGLELADRAGRDDLGAALMGWLGGVDSSAGELVSALDWLEKADRRGVGRFVGSLSFKPQAQYWAGQLARGLDDARRLVALSRSFGDIHGLMFSMPALGLILASAGQYREAFELLAEAQSVARRHGVDRMAPRALAMEGGVHLELGDLDRAISIAERAVAEATAAGFPPPVVSASIDLLFAHTRAGDLERARALVPGVEQALATAHGWHGWLWEQRVAAARAELALLDGQPDQALATIEAVVNQDPRRPRPKYRIVGLLTRARAREQLGQRAEAQADLQAGLNEARSLGDPLLILRVLERLLDRDAAQAACAEAWSLIDRVEQALPTQAIQQAFTGSPLVRRILQRVATRAAPA
jgi:tetratricopeptide (TPR) repeat protein